MKIEHSALWTKDLEASKNFYVKFFEGKAGNKYVSDKEDFQSYFVSFDGNARLEIMQIPMAKIDTSDKYQEQFFGYSHLAFSVGSIEKVNALTEDLRKNNYIIVSEPRFTGDGYYESCILDADYNRVEITV
jgi:lactoylglutathione lyase